MRAAYVHSCKILGFFSSHWREQETPAESDARPEIFQPVEVAFCLFFSTKGS